MSQSAILYRAFEIDDASNLFTMVDKHMHLQDRRLLSQAFSRAAVMKMEVSMHDKVVRLMDSIRGKIKDGFDPLKNLD
jgi:cytochrome P450